MIRSGRARRFLGSGRGTLAALACGLVVAMSWGVSPALPVARAAVGPLGQALVILSRSKVAFTGPSNTSTKLGTVASSRPLTGVRTVLPVLGERTGTYGRGWIEVRLPGRPNGHSGWITTAGTSPSWTPWRLSVNLDARVVTVYYRGRVIRRFPAVVGKPSTPTPTGHFFIEEGLSLSAGASGAPFALASSARSDVYQDFDGGPGQIALHGMGGLAGALGTASSHGCVRLDVADITWLAMRIGPGVPLRIVT